MAQMKPDVSFGAIFIILRLSYLSLYFKFVEWNLYLQ